MYEIFEKLLEERGITAYKVAKATGISTGSLTDWKKGRSAPKADKLQKIADYFGVTVDYLLGNEPKEKKPTEAHKPDYMRLFESLPEKDQKEVIALMEFKAAHKEGG